uniref:Uncharacterized protein n=1 Tax=Setaria viridis TaxID=4556 RepID=A0A4U6TCP8_SETVI|nr:hypothetical protein SEVIR_9G328500v2 [Setaria viridis]
MDSESKQAELATTVCFTMIRRNSCELVLQFTQNAICLLLWLETTLGFDDVLHNVTTMAPEDISLARIVYEANAMYTYVLHGYAIPPTFQGIRTVMDLCGEGQLLVDFGFFMFHKDLVARGVTMIRDNVGRLVFDENLHAMLRRYEDDCNSFLIPNPVPAPELMAPFVIATTPPPEDSRTVFVSVPEGNPLTSQDILNYFESILFLATWLLALWVWGSAGFCIERVAMERPCAGQSAQHGVVVFSSVALRSEAMMGESATFFRVDDGRDMWVQAYLPPC